MNNPTEFKRPFIWLKRFRHRCGYGVHSPFAFDFITTVIYEKAHYYAYSEIEDKSTEKNKNKKINRLLFRLVNRVQPENVVEAGVVASASEYIRSAKKDVTYTHFANYEPVALPGGKHVDFLYVHYTKETGSIEKTLDACKKLVHKQTVFVLEGIHSSKEMKQLWNKMMEDKQTGITFDLYDVGIIFFDDKRTKQHYIVNF